MCKTMRGDGELNKTNSGANTNTTQILLDIFVLVCAFGITFLIRGQRLDDQTQLRLEVLTGVFLLLYLLSNKEGYLYNVTMFYYLDRVHRKITKSFVVAMLVTGILLQFVAPGQEAREFFIIYLIMAYLLISIKMIFGKPLIRMLEEGRAPRTAYVGKKREFNKFSYFLDKTSIPVKMVGYIAMKRDEYEADKEEYLGCLEELEQLIRENNLDQIYIIQKHGEELPFTQQYVDICIDMGVTVRLVVDFYKRRRAYSYVSTVGTYPVITYHTISLNTYEMAIKRLMDIIGGMVGILLFSPVMLVTAVAIKLDSPGPVIFKQTRVGQNGRNFKIYKFRSMYIDAEERKKELMAQNEIAGGVMFKMKDDPRITKVGRVIRKFSIDELPQFFNVVGGSMSLVGTRPPTLDEVEKYERKQWRRISIKPGITGMWQVNGRSKIDNFDDIVEMDVEYIDNWSLMSDIKIILKTFIVLLKHDDAY
mgnify:FL=1